MLEILQGSAGLALGLAFVSGLVVGSFLNVVILNLPPWLAWQWRRDSREALGLPDVDEPPPPGIAVRGSACPNCGRRLPPWENIPLLSFALLRGRCRGCGTRISWQYPTVELLTGVLFAACVWRFGAGPEALAAMAFTALLVAMSGIDLRTMLLPEQLTLPLVGLGLVLSTVPMFATPVEAIWGAVLGYLSLWGVYWGFKLLTGKEGMGYGDFMLLAGLGAWMGGWALLPIVLMSSFIGAIVGSLWLGLRGRDHATPIPFGPYLATAGWVQLMWGESILRLYRSWAGLG